MPRNTRRSSPALIVSIVALFVALAGTAAAAVIINSPDQLGDRVVTERALDFNAVSSGKIADGAVHGVHMVHPSLRARVNKDGSRNRSAGRIVTVGLTPGSVVARGRVGRRGRR